MSLVITMRDESGRMESVFTGPSEDQLKLAHERRECDMNCGYCYHEACIFQGDTHV